MSDQDWAEINFDGLVGPSHNYGGLSFGNIASASNEGLISNPKSGALQGLEKMQTLRGLGLVQAILPPHDRPHFSTLRSLGYTGSDEEILSAVATDNPALLANVSSASTMWTANAATISPAPDTADGRTHFTAANLAAMYHRSIEAETTSRILKQIFPEGDHFAHHEPLAGGIHMGDEGAANHNRFCNDYGDPGVALFVYGRRAFEKRPDLKYPGRQTMEASQAVARTHKLNPEKTLFAQQSPAAINAGAFHNDVVAVANRNVFFYHEQAFDDIAGLQAGLRDSAPDIDFEFIEVPASEVPLNDAVKSYLFNSQLISVPGSVPGSVPSSAPGSVLGDAGMTLILPKEAEETASTATYVSKLCASNASINNAVYMDVRQSMRNGGGPACLRLRVALSAAARSAIGARVIVDDSLMVDLKSWVERHYRDRLISSDLQDPLFARESFTALDELTTILQLGSVYDFQR